MTVINPAAFSRKAAYHEAGHAVAARALGMPVTSVDIEVRGDEFGRCRLDNRNTTDRQELIYLLAGPIAEARYRKRSLVEAMLSGLDNINSDFHQVKALLKELPEQVRDAAGEQTYEQARELINARWSEIKALAERLINEGIVRWIEPDGQVNQRAQN